jgi:type VI protein secretion system component VasF
MSTQHTPGPWVVYDDSNDGKTNRLEIAARGKTVARIYHSVPEEDLPNACLIAAAPDLLEALQRLRKMCTPELSHQEALMCRVIDAAIAKATTT